MRLTVLGKSPSWQDAGGACSGYLVEAEGTFVLLDCGNGVLAKLRQRIDYLDLSAVIISHVHADHVLDLAPLSYALRYSPRQQPVEVEGYPAVSDPVRPELRLPPGGIARIRRLVGSWGDEDLVEGALETSEYLAGEQINVGPLRIDPTPVPHYTETYALTVSHGDASFTFSADCAPSGALVEAARGSALLIAEATVPHPERKRPRGHMTPGEAGKIAAEAGVERLVLTHISDEFDPERAVAAARAAYDGQVEVASEGLTVDL